MLGVNNNNNEKNSWAKISSDVAFISLDRRM